MNIIKAAALAATITALIAGPALAVTAQEKAALAAIEKNPSGDAAFAAIQKLMQEVTARAFQQKETLTAEDRKVMKQLAELLLQHHTKQKDLSNTALMYVFAVPIDEQMGYTRRLYAATPVMATKSGLAANFINTAERAFHDRSSSPAQRERIRKAMVEFVAQIRKDFADNEFRLRHAELGLASLDYSLGDRFPAVEWPLVGGKGATKVADHRGRVLVVDIWATWCPPCVEGQPGLLAFSEEMKGRPLEVITLSMDKAAEDVVAHQKKQSMPWVNAYIGFKAPILGTLGIGSYPTYFVLDENGVIRARVGEFDEATKDYVRELVSGLGKATAAAQ